MVHVFPPSASDDHALVRYDGRKQVHQGDEFMAKITAERLVRHLERSGFVLMKKPPRASPAVGARP
jgi:hypothetical protein